MLDGIVGYVRDDSKGGGWKNFNWYVLVCVFLVFLNFMFLGYDIGVIVGVVLFI